MGYPPLIARLAIEDIGRRRALLDGLYARFHKAEFLESDPLAFAHAYAKPRDREVVALIAASFAFGNVKALKAAVADVLKPLGKSPARVVAENDAADWKRCYRGFTYRWVTGPDVRVYLSWIGEALRRHGTLGMLWATLDDPREPTVLPTLARFTEALGNMPAGGLTTRKRTIRRPGGEPSALPSGARLLLTSPAGKSACKRMNLFLRWVCRPDDGIDLGLWDVDTSRLVMPVDTHILQAATMLGFTERTTADLRTALEITHHLRLIAPADPCRYDFALTRPGIMKLEEEIAALRQH